MIIKYCKVAEEPYKYEARYYVGKNEYYEYKMCKTKDDVFAYARSKHCGIRFVFRFKYQRLQ